jgi:hypothetical protein
MVGPARDNLGNFPIFSQPVLPPDLDDARIQDKLEALNLSIGITNQKKIINHGRLDAKGRKARKEEVENEDEEDQLDEEIQNYPFSAHIPKNLMNKDPNLHFMESRDIGFWHLQNTSDFIRNGHAGTRRKWKSWTRKSKMR